MNANQIDIKVVARLAVIVVILYSLLLCLWSFLNAYASSGRTSLYWPIISPVTLEMLAALGVGLLVLAVAHIVARSRALYCIASVCGVICFACLGTAMAFGSSYHLDTAQMSGHVYHLACSTNDNGTSDYYLCECEKTGTLCRCHKFYEDDDAYSRPTVFLVPRNEANELDVWINGDLLYTYGDLPRCYDSSWHCVD